MPTRDLIVVGGSAGSLTPLDTVITGLPGSLQACVIVVVHSSSDSAANLARILQRHSQLPVSIASDESPIEAGIIVSPPDRHIIVTPGQIRVVLGPKENGFRPAIDPLFRTAAHVYGERVIGVLLSGGLDDGVYGLREIKANHGLTIVQDPEGAEVASMPRNAISHVDIDHILQPEAIAPVLIRESRPRPGGVAMGGGDFEDPQLPGVKTNIAEMNLALGPPSGLTCPDCGGALWQIEDGGLVRFRCHVGHHYSPESLAVQQNDRVESALWSAVRALEERAELQRRLASQTEEAGLSVVSESFAEQAYTTEQRANEIRGLLARSEAPEHATEPKEVPARRRRSRQR